MQRNCVQTVLLFWVVVTSRIMLRIIDCVECSSLLKMQYNTTNKYLFENRTDTKNSLQSVLQTLPRCSSWHLFAIRRKRSRQLFHVRRPNQGISCQLRHHATLSLSDWYEISLLRTSIGRQSRIILEKRSVVNCLHFQKKMSISTHFVYISCVNVSVRTDTINSDDGKMKVRCAV